MAKLKLVIVLFVLVWVSSVHANANITLQEDGPISGLLYNLVLEFPDVSFSLFGNEVSLQNLTCSHLTADVIGIGFASLSKPDPQSSTKFILDLAVYDMALNCSGDFILQPRREPPEYGNLTMNIGAGTSLNIRAVIFQNLTELPSASPSPSISPSISFSNSASVSMVSASISASTSHALNNSSSASPTPSNSLSASPTPNNSSSVPPTATISVNTSNPSSAVSSSTVGSLDKFAKAAIAEYISQNLEEVLGNEVKNFPMSISEKKQFIILDETEGQVAPYIEIVIQNCSMDATVTYLNTTSETLNENIGAITGIIQAAIPSLVCAKLASLLEEGVEPLINCIFGALSDASGLLNEDNPGFIFNEEGFLYAFLGATCLFLLMMFFLLILPTIFRLYKEHQKAKLGELEPLIDDYQSQSSVVIPKKTDSPLIMDRRLAWYWRYLLLLIILYNVALFASSTVSVASSVYIYLTIGETVLRLPSIYSFMIVSSVTEMWTAKVYALSLLIGITSGIWPYVKLIIMFFLLLIPPKFLAPKWRKRILRLLDALGKWSLIDVYVLVFFIEAFRVNIPIAPAIAVDIAVTAQYAFFSYLLATIISLTLTHIFLFVHDVLEEPAVPDNGKMEYLLNHKFRYGGQSFYATLFGKILVPVLIFIAAAGVLVGSSVDAFELDWNGSLVGDLLTLTSGPDSTTKEFSVFSLLTDIPNTSFNNDSEAGIRTIQVAYAMFVLVIPLLHLFSLLAAWIAPLTMQMQRAAYITIEILSAWSAMDVFIVALIVALLQLQAFADFLIEPKCDTIKNILIGCNLSVLADAIPTCFTVKANLQSGSWILVAAVIVLLGVGYPVMYICNKAIRERKESEIKHLQKTGSMSDMFEPDRTVTPITVAIVKTLKVLFCVRFT